MLQIDDAYTKRTLVPALERVHEEVTQTLKSLTLDELFMRPKPAWSPADTLRHLIKSVNPILIVLRLPKLLLALLFGTSKKPSRKYAEIRNAYLRELANGLQAGRYAPALDEPPITVYEAQKVRKKIIKKWLKLGKALAAALRGWSDGDLDRYRLPHPALGKLSMREMLFFMMYHNLHHVNTVRKRLHH